MEEKIPYNNSRKLSISKSDLVGTLLESKKIIDFCDSMNETYIKNKMPFIALPVFYRLPDPNFDQDRKAFLEKSIERIGSNLSDTYLMSEVSEGAMSIESVWEFYHSIKQELLEINVALWEYNDPLSYMMDNFVLSVMVYDIGDIGGFQPDIFRMPQDISILITTKESNKSNSIVLKSIEDLATLLCRYDFYYSEINSVLDK